MSIRNYLEEAVKFYPSEGMVDIDAELVKSEIYKKCRPYMNLLKQKEPIIRGMTGGYKKGEPQAGIRDVRQNRRPRGFSDELFDDLNKWIVSKGGARRDKSVIGSPQIPPFVFGPRYWIFPVGKLNYTYVKSKDFNVDRPSTPQRSGWAEYSVEILEILMTRFREFGKNDPQAKEMDKKAEKLFGFNEGFSEAYNKKYEIWFQCKEFIFVPFLNYRFMDIMGYKGNQSASGISSYKG